jgi:hypothetical protein
MLPKEVAVTAKNGPHPSFPDSGGSRAQTNLGCRRFGKMILLGRFSCLEHDSFSFGVT